MNETQERIVRYLSGNALSFEEAKNFWVAYATQEGLSDLSTHRVCVKLREQTFWLSSNNVPAPRLPPNQS